MAKEKRLKIYKITKEKLKKQTKISQGKNNKHRDL